MKADRLTRKTNLKRHQNRPDGEITIYDLTQQAPEPYFKGDMALSSIEYKQDMDPQTISALPYAFESVADVLAWCAAMIAESPTASALWAEASDEGWVIGLDNLQSGGFHIDIPEKQLVLDHFALTPSALGRSAYFRNIVLTTLVRALRDIWHEKRFGAFEGDFAPEGVLMLERVRVADGDTVTVQAAWEMRGAGFPDVWRHLIGSEEGDMAMVFTKVLERDPSAVFDGSALAYAFRQWYAHDQRVDACDHDTLETLDDLLVSSSVRNPFGHKKVEESLIEEMSALPDGTRYLGGKGDTVLSDPIFSGLNDPINQSHLFHLIYDIEVTMVNNVPFKDKKLARKIFPQSDNIKSWI